MSHDGRYRHDEERDGQPREARELEQPAGAQEREGRVQNADGLALGRDQEGQAVQCPAEPLDQLRGDDVALDLVRALTDDHERRVPEVALDVELGGVAVPAVHLHCVGGHRARHGGYQHRGDLVDLAGAGVVGLAIGFVYTGPPLRLANKGLGEFAVDGFFLISGYVIAWSAEGRGWLDFAVARFVRLYPGFLVCMTITFAVMFAGCSKAPEAGAQKRLTVAVKSETWRKHLENLSGQMIFKINSVLGQAVVTYIEFHIDEKAVERENLRDRKQVLSDEEFEEIALEDADELDLSAGEDELARAIVKAAFIGPEGRVLPQQLVDASPWRLESPPMPEGVRMWVAAEEAIRSDTPSRTYEPIG